MKRVNILPVLLFLTSQSARFAGFLFRQFALVSFCQVLSSVEYKEMLLSFPKPSNLPQKCSHL